jgi:hypothetical protein
MEKFSLPQKIISVLMCLILMLEFSGCYSTRIISTSEITASDKYLIHCNNSTYSVDKVGISNGILSGKPDFSENNHGSAKKTHIYLSANAPLKINNDLISVPVSCVTKIEQYVPEPGKTATLIILFTAVGIGIGIGSWVLISNLIMDITTANTSTIFCSNW